MQPVPLGSADGAQRGLDIAGDAEVVAVEMQGMGETEIALSVEILERIEVVPPAPEIRRAVGEGA